MISFGPTRKRKDVDNPLLASRDQAKVRLVEKSTDGVLHASAKPHVRPGLPASRTMSNFRRGSLKIFSMFRTSKRQAPSDTRGSASNRSRSNQGAESTRTSATYVPSIHSFPAKLPALSLHKRGSSSLQLTNAPGFDGESEPLIRIRDPRPTALHRSRSTPGLSRHLTAKISIALLNNDTVIHRPKLMSRPKIRTDHFEHRPDDQSAVTSPQTPMSDVPSLPSSFLGSSIGPLSLSTTPTSLISSGAPISIDTTHRVHNEPHQIPAGGSPPLQEPTTEQNPPRFLVFPRQDAPRLSKPSVATIENAAAAKVFFESHFNQLLGTKISPRSMRRRQVERKLFALALPNEQRNRQRRE